MSKKDNIYVIISLEDVEDIDFDQVMQTSAQSLRISEDGTSTFVKFQGATPSFLAVDLKLLSTSLSCIVYSGPFLFIVTLAYESNSSTNSLNFKLSILI